MNLEQAKFPSPYGVTVIKSFAENEVNKIVKSTFPSPYGVTVIKSNIERIQ